MLLNRRYATTRRDVDEVADGITVVLTYTSNDVLATDGTILVPVSWFVQSKFVSSKSGLRCYC